MVSAGRTLLPTPGGGGGRCRTGFQPKLGAGGTVEGPWLSPGSRRLLVPKAGLHSKKPLPPISASPSHRLPMHGLFHHLFGVFFFYFNLSISCLVLIAF